MTLMHGANMKIIYYAWLYILSMQVERTSFDMKNLVVNNI